MEPEQLGVGTLDGNILILRSLESWSAEIEAGNATSILAEELARLEGIAALDLHNADGGFYRSSAIDEIIDFLPALAGMVKAQWQTGVTTYWQRVNGSWRKSETSRGGFQGLRLVTVLFCCSLRRALREATATAASTVPKPAYQDDTYLLES